MENCCVEFYCSEQEYLNDAVDRIVVKVIQQKKSFNKKVILLTGCSPSCGVTTLSINLSIALCLAGFKTILVDGDLRKKGKYKRLGSVESLGLCNYLSSNIRKEQMINSTNYDLLDCILSGFSSVSPVKLLCHEKTESLIQSLKEDYDFVIMDSSSINIVPDVNIIMPYIDGIILVSALNQTTKKQLWHAKEIIKNQGDKYYGLIINQVNMRLYSQVMQGYDYFMRDNLQRKYNKQLKKLKRQKGSEGIEESSKGLKVVGKGEDMVHE